MKAIQSMVLYRSILSFILVIVATFLVSCGSPTTASVPQTYTADQVEQIQQSVPDILKLRDRLPEIPRAIQQRNWIDVSDFIHGPMAELRLKMNYLSRNFLPKDREGAQKATRAFFDDLVKIYQAAEQGDVKKATQNYQEALSDIDAFLQFVPQASSSEG